MASTPKFPSSRQASDTRIRQRKGVTRPVKAPLGGVKFKWYIYILAVVTLGYAVYSAYRMSEIQRTKAINMREQLKAARGTPTAAPGAATGGVRQTVQQKIEDLADMLGLEPVLLASAIAGVVKEHIPAASSSSIVQQAKQSESASVISALSEGLEGTGTEDATPTATEGVASTASSVAGVAASVASMVMNAGFDDMGIELD